MKTNKRMKDGPMPMRFAASLLVATACGLFGCEANSTSGVSVARVEPERSSESYEGDEPTEGERAIRDRLHRRGWDIGPVPDNVFIAAKEESDRLPVLEVTPGQRDAGIWTWEWLGPSNIGGRARALVFDTDPNRMWIGTAGGGVWRTTNGGASWTPLTDWLANLSVSALCRDPLTDRMWAGTGEQAGSSSAWPGAGIFFSDDDGGSWTQIAATSSLTVNRIVQSTDRTYLLAATSQGIWRGTASGTSWVRVNDTTSVADVECHPSDPNLAVAGRYDGVVLRSTDRGQTWTATTTFSGAGRVELAYAPSSTARVYASVNVNNGEVWRSTDGGVTFTRRNTGTNYFVNDPNGNSQGNYDNALWVAPDNSNTIVVGGINLWRSTDGGATLTRISDWLTFHFPGNSAHADQHLIVEHPNYSASNRRVYVLNDGGIQTASDILGDSTLLTYGWTKLVNGLGISQFYTVGAAPDGDVVMGGTQDNSFLRYYETDPVSAWAQPTTGDGAYVAIDHQDPGLRYASTQFLNILRAGFGSDLYLPQTNGLLDAGDPARAGFIAPFVMAKTNSQRLIAGGSRIWRTSNGGGQWEQIRGAFGSGPFELCSAIAIGPTNSSLVWVGYGSGRVSRTTSAFGTPSWTNVHTNGLPGGFITSIAISPTDSNDVFVTIGGARTDSIWYTTDAGATWTNRNGSGEFALPAVNVNSIVFHPDNTNWIYVGTDLGVYASEDRGQTWSRTPRFGEHEGPVNVEVSMLYFDDNEELYAATHGRGIYRVDPRVKVYVDRLVTLPGNGSQSFPFGAIQQGLSASGHGTTLSIKSEDYNESGTVFFNRRMLIETTERIPGQGASVLIR